MKVDLITEKADGNRAYEIEMLEAEVSRGSEDMQVYTRLTQLYRRDRKYIKAINALSLGVKRLQKLIEEEKDANVKENG